MVEGGWDRFGGLWGIIVPSHTNEKNFQYKNYTITETHEIIYAATPRYKQQQIISVTTQIPLITKQPSTPYI